MIFKEHSRDIEGTHAFLGASKYHWINYDDEKLIKTFRNYKASEIGTRLHAFAAECIRLGVKLPEERITLNMYVNDCIDHAMTPEQILYYSENCFGTTDAIYYDKHQLFIFDLKTGSTPACMKQLEIYAAIFCLEYNIDLTDLYIELRIYQNNEVLYFNPRQEEILCIMEKIIHFDKLIDKIKKEG